MDKNGSPVPDSDEEDIFGETPEIKRGKSAGGEVKKSRKKLINKMM